VRLADYVVQQLEAAGIEHVFTVCGGGSIFMNDALRRAEKIQYVACHHEQAAAMAAEGYARLRTGLGCAMVTSGPGGTNAITGVAGAWMDSVPTLTISGQVFRSQMMRPDSGLRSLGVQEINILDLVRPITKYAVCVTDPASIRYHLEAALYFATEGRPGPVWLDIPADVQNAKVDPAALTGFHQEPRPEPGPLLELQAGAVIDALLEAKRPLVHIGQGVRLAGAQQALLAFLEFAQIPVVTARNGNDLVDSGHPLYIGRPGTFAQRGANFAVQTCDFYLAIGTRLCLAQTGYNAADYARRAVKIMVDIDRAEIDKDTVPLDMKIHADAGDFLEALNRSLGMRKAPDWSAWVARCKAWQTRYPPVTEAQRHQAGSVNSYALVEQLSQQCAPDDVIVTDMGFAFQNTHQVFHVKHGQRLFTNGGLAAMGWGLPAAIGAAFGSRLFGKWCRRVILIAGDGGLMMNLQELATLAHHRLNIKVFVLNNGGYLTMRQSQAHAFEGYMGSDAGSGIGFPDFQQTAAAFGLPALRTAPHANVAEWVRRTLATDGPVLCEVMMDPNQDTVPKSINRRDAAGRIVQTPIEDAWPYLPADELAANLKTQ
jgi:acetolactate synthase-1/2/3 large subunit